MTRHRILGDKVTLYRRRNGGKWHCATYLNGREWRKSAKQESLEQAKDVAEDWYFELCAKNAMESYKQAKRWTIPPNSLQKSMSPSHKAVEALNG